MVVFFLPRYNLLKYCNQKLYVAMLSHVRLFATLWTVTHQAPLSMGFFRQNAGASCYFLLQGIFPTQGLNPCLLN